MIADFFTKPLQGDLFKKLRAVIMGHVDLETFMSQESDTSKERVGDNGIEGSELATEMPMMKRENACEARISDTAIGHSLSQRLNYDIINN